MTLNVPFAPSGLKLYLPAPGAHASRFITSEHSESNGNILSGPPGREIFEPNFRPCGAAQNAGAASAAATVLSLSKGVVGSIDGGMKTPLAPSAAVGSK